MQSSQRSARGCGVGVACSRTIRSVRLLQRRHHWLQSGFSVATSTRPSRSASVWVSSVRVGQSRLWSRSASTAAVSALTHLINRPSARLPASMGLVYGKRDFEPAAVFGSQRAHARTMLASGVRKAALGWRDARFRIV